MNITQTFYDQLAEHYDKLFAARGFYQPIIAEKTGGPACC